MRLARRFSLPLFLAALLCVSWLYYRETHPPLPSEEETVLFYSNQKRQNLFHLYRTALLSAKKEIWIWIYSFSDPQLIGTLNYQVNEGVEAQVTYDANASKGLSWKLDKKIERIPHRGRGLMHEKILVLDEATAFLGSSNFTPTSLEIHANLVVGLFSEEIVEFLKERPSTHGSFTLDDRTVELFFLPDKEKKALEKIYELIDTSYEQVEIAMFTLTHEKIVDHLIAAKERGVDIELILDSYSAAGSGKKQVERLASSGVDVRTSIGRELLHHKWARFDEDKFLLGSTNWTKAAFEKNRDCFVFFDELLPKERQYLDNLWNILYAESRPWNEDLLLSSQEQIDQFPSDLVYS